MTESPCSAFEASSRSPSFLICLLSHVSICQLYLYGFTVCVLACLVLWCLIACYDFTFLSFSPHDSLILSLSLSICFLLLQSFIYSASRAFAPQPGPLLTDSVWFYNAHARKKAPLFSLPTIATNSDRVFLFVSELWCAQRTCLCVHTWPHIT